MLSLVFDKLRHDGRAPHHSIVIVVSPLQSLMEDQSTSFNRRGVKCAYICEKNSMNKNVIDEIHRGEYQILLLSPESMLTDLSWREMFRTTVYQENLVGIVVDEAHCVQTWQVMTMMSISYVHVDIIHDH